MRNDFFKSTPMYKEYKILELISLNEQITQRMISKEVGIAVSMVNNYLEKLEEEDLIKRNYITTKTIKYEITKKGTDYKKHLHINYLNATQKLYEEAKNSVEDFLFSISNKGFKRILLYGAGEVAEILLNTIKNRKNSIVEVVGIIDDDLNKVGKKIVNTLIINKDEINNYEHDGILISSYVHYDKILSRLNKMNYPNNKILTVS